MHSLSGSLPHTTHTQIHMYMYFLTKWEQIPEIVSFYPKYINIFPNNRPFFFYLTTEEFSDLRNLILIQYYYLIHSLHSNFNCLNNACHNESPPPPATLVQDLIKSHTLYLITICNDFAKLFCKISLISCRCLGQKYHNKWCDLSSQWIISRGTDLILVCHRLNFDPLGNIVICHLMMMEKNSEKCI